MQSKQGDKEAAKVLFVPLIRAAMLSRRRPGTSPPRRRAPGREPRRQYPAPAPIPARPGHRPGRALRWWRRGQPSPRRLPGADLARGCGEFTEGLAQRRRVLLAEVNLVDTAVQSEGDGLGGLSSVDVVDQGDGRLLGHVRCAFLVVWSSLVNADASIGPLRWPSPMRMSCDTEHLTGSSVARVGPICRLAEADPARTQGSPSRAGRYSATTKNSRKTFPFPRPGQTAAARCNRAKDKASARSTSRSSRSTPRVDISTTTDP